MESNQLLVIDLKGSAGVVLEDGTIVTPDMVSGKASKA